MASITIEVISVGQVTRVATAKGGYNALEVAYRKDGKVEGRKLVDFASKEVFKKAQEMVVGQSYRITLEKDKNDYWQWAAIDISQSEGDAVATDSPRGAAASQKSTGAVGRVTGSNYETPEERAIRQRLIVRQSSLTAALTLLIHNSPKNPIDPADVKSQAEAYVEWVFKTNPVKALADMADDIPV